MTFTHAVVVAPGCHGGPDKTGRTISRHSRLDLAVAKSSKNDRTCVVTMADGGWATDEIVYQPTRKNHPTLGAGRYGR